MFPLIYFSVGKYAWLQVDLLVLPGKGDFGGALCMFQARGCDEGRGRASDGRFGLIQTPGNG